MRSVVSGVNGEGLMMAQLPGVERRGQRAGGKVHPVRSMA